MTRSSRRPGLELGAHAVRRLARLSFVVRRSLARKAERALTKLSRERDPNAPRRRNILFITTDQQRYDSLAITGNRFTRTDAIDGLARQGILYRRAHVQNVVCMPSRATMLTGQHPLTHGVIANGVPLADDSPNVARLLHAAGYRTALIGKAHFDPHLDPWLSFEENRLAACDSTGPWRGFEHVELATHGPLGGHHYAAWLWATHPEDVGGFGAVLSGSGGGETGAPEVKHNPIPREHYHTDWVVARTLGWLRSLDEAEPFFCWMSFPDPHHPFDPPLEELKKRGDFRDRPLPAGHPGSRDEIREILANKPRHWLDWYDGRHKNPEGGPIGFAPGRMTHDQMREVDHAVQVENELVDEGIARVLAYLIESGLDADTDVFFTSDHGDLHGDFGLLFKGPYHVEGLMRVPFIWRPAPSAGVPAAVIDDPVGHVDLAPTFLAIAGLEAPSEMQGRPLPITGGSGRERVITTFDSQFAAVGMHLRTIYRDGMLCTVYEPSTRDRGGRFPFYSSVWLRGSRFVPYDGSEGELYDLSDDPRQWTNLWNDPARRKLRDELIDDLRAHLPPERLPRLPVPAPT